MASRRRGQAGDPTEGRGPDRIQLVGAALQHGERCGRDRGGERVPRRVGRRPRRSEPAPCSNVAAPRAPGPARSRWSGARAAPATGATSGPAAAGAASADGTLSALAEGDAPAAGHRDGPEREQGARRRGREHDGGRDEEASAGRGGGERATEEAATTRRAPGDSWRNGRGWGSR